MVNIYVALPADFIKHKHKFSKRFVYSSIVHSEKCSSFNET